MPQPFKQRRKVFLPDLNPEFPDHTWTFWVALPVSILTSITRPFNLVGKQDRTEAQEEDTVSAFCAASAEVVLDTGESGIDLSTPEKVREAICDDTVSELVTGIINTYIMQLLNEREAALKKAGER